MGNELKISIGGSIGGQVKLINELRQRSTFNGKLLKLSFKESDNKI